MQETYITARLSLNKLSVSDAAFIKDLVNTPGWLQFIGNRNVNSIEDAITYIHKILGNKNVIYWVVRLKESGTAIGIITLIRRDYLDHPDIGFAFLPAYHAKGYAYEAATVVLNDAAQQHAVTIAITIKENTTSIKLLEKLGLSFERELVRDGESLLVYSLRKSS
jgi:RimJ/RimL family protein N-acetyltransferase